MTTRTRPLLAALTLIAALTLAPACTSDRVTIIDWVDFI